MDSKTPTMVFGVELADDIDNKNINDYKNGWFEYFEANMPELSKRLNEGAKLSEEDIEALKVQLETYGKNL